MNIQVGTPIHVPVPVSDIVTQNDGSFHVILANSTAFYVPSLAVSENTFQVHGGHEPVIIILDNTLELVAGDSE